MTTKILFVDDEMEILEALRDAFSAKYECDCAQSGADGLKLLETNGPYAVIVADRTMPKMSGIEFLEKARASSPMSARVMLTGDADQTAAVDAVNRGKVFYFLSKPCSAKALEEVIASGVNHYRMNCTQHDISDTTVAASVSLLTDVLGAVAPEALGRGQRLKAAMQVFSDFLGIAPSERLPVAALLAPLGFASVPAVVYRKLSSGALLLPQEKAVVQRIPQLGHDLIVNLPSLQNLAKIVLYQNKHFDGRGFPEGGAAGEEIPVGARMLKILIDRLDLENEGVVKHKAHTAMAARTGVYDSWRLEKCFEAMPNFLPNSLSKEKPILHVAAADLQAGQVLVSAVASRAGFLLLGAGDRLTAITIGRLKDGVLLGEIQEPFMVQDPE